MYGKPLAYVVKIKNITPIEGADKIELATVMDYTVVVKKNEFKPGDKAMYIEVDSILPDGFTSEQKVVYDSIKDGSYFKGITPTEEEVALAKENLMKASKYPFFEFLRDKKFKIKSMKLSKFGVISQGILFAFDTIGIEDCAVGTDLTERFEIKELVQDEEEAGIAKTIEQKSKIVKWLMRFAWFRKIYKPKKVSLNWRADWPGKSDEENVQKIFTKMTAAYPGEEWIVTEKLEGQNITTFSEYVTSWFGKKKKRIGVNSRTREISPKTEYNSAFWTTTKREGFDTIVKNIEGEWFCRGEHLGPGIQGNIYKLPYNTIRYFDFYHKVDGKWIKLNYDESIAFSEKYKLPFVPVLDEHFKLPATVTELLEYSDKPTIFGNNLKHKREGVVLRLRKDYNVSFKVKNPFYSI